MHLYGFMFAVLILSLLSSLSSSSVTFLPEKYNIRQSLEYHAPCRTKKSSSSSSFCLCFCFVLFVPFILYCVLPSGFPHTHTHTHFTTIKYTRTHSKWDGVDLLLLFLLFFFIVETIRSRFSKKVKNRTVFKLAHSFTRRLLRRCCFFDIPEIRRVYACMRVVYVCLSPVISKRMNR